jgi:hypothetical protein
MTDIDSPMENPASKMYTRSPGYSEVRSRTTSLPQPAGFLAICWRSGGGNQGGSVRMERVAKVTNPLIPSA